MRMDRSKNILVSVQKGVKSMGVGIFEGITGIY